MSTLSHRRCWVEVDGRALRRNYRVLRSLVPRTTKLLAVVKANAYGHGLIPMAKELEVIGADWLGVANVAEGAALRDAGVKLPIPAAERDAAGGDADAVRHKLALTLSTYDEARRLDAIARKLRRKAAVHFKVDTGHGPPSAAGTSARARNSRAFVVWRLNIEGICTHFASPMTTPG